MTTPVGTASVNPLAYAPTPTAVEPNDQMGKDTFLQLLVAQLKYQNPMSPADGADFMAQTAQFTVVEKLDALSKSNAELLASQRALSASSLIGRTVLYADASGADVSATVTGVRFDASGPVLVTGDTEVSLSGVKEVRPAGA